MREMFLEKLTHRRVGLATALSIGVGTMGAGVL